MGHLRSEISTDVDSNLDSHILGVTWSQYLIFLNLSFLLLREV